MDTKDAQIPRSRHFQLERLADGVYAAMAIQGGGAMSNAGIIDLGDRAVVFDTFWTPQAAQDLRVAAEDLTGHPVRYVVNSHWNGDHFHGNQVFADTAEVISTSRTRDLMETRGGALIDWFRENDETYLQSREGELDQEKDENRRRQIALAVSTDREFLSALHTLKLTLPNLTFDRRLVLHGPGRDAEVISLGGGHTESDAFLYLRDEQIVFMGDLLFTKNHPSMWNGGPEEWISILAKIEDLEVKVAVPGHGPLGTREDLVLLRQYITELLRMASTIVRNGGTVDDAACVNIPPSFDTWDHSDLFARNMRFLHEIISCPA